MDSLATLHPSLMLTALLASVAAVLVMLGLRRTERQYRRLVELSPDLIAVHVAGRFVYVNSAGAQLLGAPSPSAMVGRRVLDFVHPSAHDQVAQRIDEVQKSREVPHVIEPLVRMDGSIVYCEVAAIPMKYFGRAAVQVTARDVSDRLDQESLLRRQALVFETVEEAVLIMDPESRILDCNPAAERVLGYPRKDLIGQTPTLFHDPAIAGRREREIRNAVRERGRWAGEIPIRHKDGLPASVETAVVGQFDPNGALTGLIGVSRDVTERRLLEERLRQSERMEAVGRLAGGIAHDFNNLLTVIRMNCGIMLRDPTLGSDSRSGVNEVMQASERAAALTSQLLAFSRRQVLKPIALDVKQLVASVGGMLRRVIGEDIRLVTRYDGGDLWVRADPGQLTQVLMNLAVNARDAMSRGGTLEIVAAESQLAEAVSHRHGTVPVGRWVTITMHDSGTGIDDAVIPHIFEPFFTTKEAGKGTGLGLATVHGIVSQSGGHLTVETTPGGGSAFRVYLPAVYDLPERPDVEPAPAIPESGDETILLVEDEEPVRAITSKALRRLGYRVVEATNGREAIAWLQSRAGSADLVISDVVMPDLGGSELADWLSRERPGTPLLLMSGYAGDARLQRTLDGPGRSFLAKPFEIGVLTQTVRALLGAARAGGR